ncbi:MAG: SpoIID/LytB domain-containing protein [Nocardioides sp.]
MPHLSRHRPAHAVASIAALCAVLVASAVMQAPAGAVGAAERRAESWVVPAKASITLTGHGYGHGHGMSQYGAEGAARQGIGFAQIVDFYYPGTTWSTAKGAVSVLVSADTTDDLEVLARPGLTLRDLSSRERLVLPAGPTRFRLVTNAKAVTTLDAFDGAWTTLRTLGNEGEFLARGPITLVTPGGQAAYRGRLRAAAPKPGSTARDTVNIVGLEKYLRGVVPREIPASWSPEAVRAQAVAARTYAAYERAHPRAAHYQICDTTSCQVYGGTASEQAAATEAVKATKGQIVTDGVAPAFSQFSASSGGWTAAGSVPYLAAREDPYDGWAGNPVHTWTRTLSDDAIESRYPSIGQLQQIVVGQRDGNGDWGGRVGSLTLVGSSRSVTVTGDSLRAVLGLRSTWFTFAVAARS